MVSWTKESQTTMYKTNTFHLAVRLFTLIMYRGCQNNFSNLEHQICYPPVAYSVLYVYVLTMFYIICVLTENTHTACYTGDHKQTYSWQMICSVIAHIIFREKIQHIRVHVNQWFLRIDSYYAHYKNNILDTSVSCNTACVIYTLP